MISAHTLGEDYACQKLLVMLCVAGISIPSIVVQEVEAENIRTVLIMKIIFFLYK